MLIYQEFLALNEELAAFDPTDKLRWAVHEIVIKLKSNEEIKFDALSKILKEEYKIDISEKILKDIFTAWDDYNNGDFSIFKKEDKNWMEVWPYANYIKKKARFKQNFGKHRKKDTPTYNTDYNYGRNYNTKVWRNGKWEDSSNYNPYYGD